MTRSLTTAALTQHESSSGAAQLQQWRSTSAAAQPQVCCATSTSLVLRWCRAE